MGLKDFIKNNIYEGSPAKERERDFVEDRALAPQAVKPLSMQTEYRDSSSGSSQSSPIEVDTFRKHFDDLMKENNIPAVDYYEFVVAKNKMSGSEESKYKTAFAVLESAGLTKEIIMSSTGTYKAIIQKDVANFNANFDSKYKAEVLDKKAAADDKQKELDEVNRRAAQLKLDISGLRGSADSQDAILTAKKSAFMQAASEASSTIDQEISKVNQYI